MNSRFKFPRRVRIHGGECGAVARALHHEAQKDALMSYEQTLVTAEKAVLSRAELGNVPRSTIERKQMSTKTTLKRIALVAVSALGFGLLSTVPATAGFPVTTSLTLGWSSLTIVKDGVSNNHGMFYADANRLATASSTSTTRAALVTGETVRVFVSSFPTGRAASDIKITYVTNASSAISSPFADSGISGDGDNDMLITGGTDTGSPNNVRSSSVAGNELNRYWFAVSTDTASVIGAGEYTLTVRLTNDEGQVKDYPVKVKFVQTIADAGAVLTLAKTGSISRKTAGSAFDFTANTNVQATLRDANGGRVQTGIALNGVRTGWVTPLTATLVNADGVPVSGASLSIGDTGVTTQDHVACGTGGAAACLTGGTTESNQQLYQAINATGDGVYGVYATGITAAASTTTSVRVRVTNSNVESSIAIAVIEEATGVANETDVRINNATGILPAHTLFRDVAGTAGTNTLTYTLPLTVTAPSLTFDINTASAAVGAGGAYTSTVTWGSNVASANVTPASATSAVNYTDADGRFTVALTNTTPVAGASVSVAITGFATVDHKVTVTLTWASPVASTLTIVDPIASQYIKTGSSTVFTAKVTDQFGNAVAGEQIVPSITGTTSANYSATTTYAAVTSDKDGMVSWTLVDAKAVNDSTDTVKFTDATDSTVTDSRTITYKTTLPAVSTMSNFYSDTFAAAASAITTAVPSVGIGSELAMVINRNLSFDLSQNANSAADDMIALRVRALTSAGVAATGAAVTLTAGTGGHVLNISGLPATSRTIAVNGDGDVVFQIMATKTGPITFTITSGTASSTVRLNMVSAAPATSARTVAITGGKTGTANGEGVPMTVTVTDRYGNGASGVNLNVTASGAGALMGGATTASFTTDVNGTFTFLATSYASAGGAATFTASASNAGDSTSAAGRQGTNVVDSTLAAGVSSASATVTFAAGVNAAQAAAEAASDAAAEAIDAANAATDAANLAAEAADAATVAAEEARDAADAATAAVEELATQVATLMAALKAQITTLANTVAKIAKKVRA